MINSINLNKDIKIETPVLLAPMAGVTDLPYREMVAKFGYNIMYSEMISSNAIVRGSSKSLKMSNISTNSLTGIQIAGSDIEVITTAAKIAEENGASILDINMGCPVKKVTKGIAGSALMKEETLVGKIFEALVNAVSIPVTVKMRLGWDYESINSPKLAYIAQESGLKMVTVHGRTRQQFYTGSANWKMINDVKKAVSIPVIANGDIKTKEQLVQALEDSEADGVMIGRGTYGKPWVIHQFTEYIKTGVFPEDLPLEEKLATCIEHYEKMINYYGKQSGLRIARKHLSWYTKGLRNSAELRAKINISEDTLEVRDLVESCFQSHKEYITQEG